MFETNEKKNEANVTITAMVSRGENHENLYSRSGMRAGCVHRVLGTLEECANLVPRVVPRMHFDYIHRPVVPSRAASGSENACLR